MSGGNLGIELPRLLLNCFQRITFTFPESATPKLVLLPAGRNPPVLDSIGKRKERERVNEEEIESRGGGGGGEDE